MKIRKKASTNSIFQAAGILMVMMMISRVLGFVRDIVLTSNYGLNYETDAYYAAFAIPDVIYFALVGGALSSSFIPVFISSLAKEQKEDSDILASTIINLVGLGSLFLILIGIIFTPELLGFLVQFEGKTFELTVFLTRIMFIQCFFMCLTGIFQGMLQCYKHFTMPAVGAVLYNLAIIVFGCLFTEKLGITAFTLGVIVGAVLNCVIQIPIMRQFGFHYRPIIDLHHPGVKQFFTLMIPVLLGLTMSEVNLLVNQYLGSGLGESILSAMKQAQRIMQLPIGIFGAAIMLSVFPSMASHAAVGEMDKYKHDLSMGIRTILFITVPATVGLIVVREPMVRAMYLQAAFTQVYLDSVTSILFFYCFGIAGYSLQQMLNRGFYAIQDTKTPVRINVSMLILNIVLSFILVKPFAEYGLAAAYSIAGLTSMVVLYVFLQKKIGSIGGIAMVKSVVKSIFASILMGIIVYFAVNITNDLWDLSNKLVQVAQVVLCIGIGVAAYAGAAIAMKMEEATMVLGIIKRKLKR